MADKDEGQLTDSTTPKAADWEVVSLTASAYAAAPGGRFPPFKPEENREDVKKDETETSNALFMSGHFVLPSQSESENSDLGGKSDPKEEENWDLKKLTELAFKGKEQSIYDSHTLDSLQSEATIGALNVDENVDDEMSGLDESAEASDAELSQNIPSVLAKEVNHGGYGAMWWRKHAECLYARVKETNTFWSVFAVAALMGIVVIGHRWRQEKWQGLRQELKSRIHDEKIRITPSTISGFKNIIIGGHQQDFSIRGSISKEL